MFMNDDDLDVDDLVAELDNLEEKPVQQESTLPESSRKKKKKKKMGAPGMAPPGMRPPGMSPGDESKETDSSMHSSRDYGGDVLGAAESKRGDDHDEAYSTGGGVIQNSAASRARVLQQQREMAMKRRSNQMQSGMMMRTDGPRASNLMSGMDSQNTPAMRQFSAPKKAVDEEEDSENEEWSDPNSGKGKKTVKSDFMEQTGKRREGYERQEGEWANEKGGIDLREEEADSKRRLRQEREREQRRREDEEREGAKGGGRGGGGRNGNANNFRGYPEDERYEADRRRDYERGGYDDRRGGYDDRRGGYDGRRGGGRGDDRYREGDRYRGGRDERYRDDDRYRRDDDRYRREDDRYRRDDRDRDRRGGEGGGRGEERRREGGSERNARRQQAPPAAAQREEPPREQRPSGGRKERPASGEKEDMEKMANQARTESFKENPPASHTAPAKRPNPDEKPFSMDELNLDKNMKSFLMSPVPKRAGVIQCYIKRNKSGTQKLYPTYSIFLKEGDRFLMTSKRRPNNKTSNYLISMEMNDHNRNSTNYLGKVRANFVGTEFQIYDSGINYKDAGGGQEEIRQELGCVLYASNVLGSRGPRKMQVCINKVDESKGMVQWQPRQKDAEMLTLFKNKDEFGIKNLVSLINKPPRWNDQVGAYVLNFNGRVTMASVKNFQLVDQFDHDTIILQFGRVAKDEFTCDFQWPITPFQAFAITLSSFDSKIACD